MGDLDTDLATVDGLEHLEDVAQLHALIAAAGETPGVELGIHVGLAQTEIVELQHARRRAVHQAERIDVCDLVAAQAIHLN